MTVNAFGVMFDLSCFHFFQQIIDIFVIRQRHLDAHVLQALHRRLAHAAADEVLAIGDIFEFCGVGGIASHAQTAALSMAVVMVAVVVVVMMLVTTGVGHLA